MLGACALVVQPLLTEPLAAQGDTIRARPAVSEVPVVGPRDVTLAGALVLGAAAVAPFDRRIARASQRPSLQDNRALHDVAQSFNALGGPGTVILPVAAWAIGRVAHNGPLATTGVRVGEAVALGAVVTDLVKGVAGRARPYAVADSNAADFRLGHGFGGERRTSFPSGHATAAWAAAGMLDAELKAYWPRAERVAGPAAYAGAGVVSLARIYTNKHWASDVIVGAAVGSLAARVVAHYHRDHPRNPVDRLFLEHGTAPPPRADAARDATEFAGLPLVGWSFAW